MSKLQVKVVTPYKVFFEGEVDNIIVRTTEGDVGFMKNHTPYLAALSTGFLRIFIDNKEQKAISSNGIVQVFENNVNILVNYCELSSDIDINKIKSDISFIENKLKDSVTEEESKVYKDEIDSFNKIINFAG
ncbi:MAG: ATP synthase F1 subunit epsilon [Oscillospiraceae bacterium]